VSGRARHHIASNRAIDINGRELPREATPGGVSFTRTDDAGHPDSVLFLLSDQYLSRPARRRLVEEEVIEAGHHPNGPLLLRTGRQVASPPRLPAAPVDATADRIVTFDTSVLVAGIDPALFRPDDALFISAMLYLEQAVTLGNEAARDEDYTAYGHWDLTTPVPIDHYVTRVYQELCSGGSRNPMRDLERDLHRTDLVCAATAILYDATLYTTHPDSYKGLSPHVRTLTYGPVRNKAALTPEPRPDPLVVFGLRPPG